MFFGFAFPYIFMFLKKENKGRFERVNLSYAIVLGTLQVNSLAVVYLGYFYLILFIWSFFFVFKIFCIGIFSGGLERVKLFKFVSISSALSLYLYICFNCNKIQKPL
jgi:hypothetical protein